MHPDFRLLQRTKINLNGIMPGQLVTICSIELTFQKRMRHTCDITHEQKIAPRVVDDDVAQVEAIITLLTAIHLGCRTHGIGAVLSFIDPPFLAQRIGQLGEDITLTPLLKPATNGFVIRIALRHQVPLRPCGANPKHRLSLSCQQ
jgi:hypothetical protein